jgi:hypothetical protein
MRGKLNFFILGAPKCGTTSMSAWLEQPPAIFIAAMKEPNYFNTNDNREPIYGVAHPRRLRNHVRRRDRRAARRRRGLGLVPVARPTC